MRQVIVDEELITRGERDRERARRIQMTGRHIRVQNHMKTVRLSLRVFTLTIDYHTGGVDKLPIAARRSRSGPTWRRGTPQTHATRSS